MMDGSRWYPVDGIASISRLWNRWWFLRRLHRCTEWRSSYTSCRSFSIGIAVELYLCFYCTLYLCDFAFDIFFSIILCFDLFISLSTSKLFSKFSRRLIKCIPFWLFLTYIHIELFFLLACLWRHNVNCTCFNFKRVWKGMKKRSKWGNCIFWHQIPPSSTKNSFTPYTLIVARGRSRADRWIYKKK